jgi:hypothetical protein
VFHRIDQLAAQASHEIPLGRAVPIPADVADPPRSESARSRESTPAHRARAAVAAQKCRAPRQATCRLLQPADDVRAVPAPPVPLGRVGACASKCAIGPILTLECANTHRRPGERQVQLGRGSSAVRGTPGQDQRNQDLRHEAPARRRSLDAYGSHRRHLGQAAVR